MKVLKTNIIGFSAEETRKFVKLLLNINTIKCMRYKLGLDEQKRDFEKKRNLVYGRKSGRKFYYSNLEARREHYRNLYHTRKDKVREYREKNKEKIRIGKRKEYLKHGERYREMSREYYLKNS